ncbi:MAG: acetyl-CoA acetyltransferase [Proteobacteria bacterium]|nr:acetyl-CoA acetyltransferase [Pseudomonadota bacterium]
MSDLLRDIDPNTPVLVGVAAVQQKFENHTEGVEAIALMERALRDAARDAGAPELLAAADEILVPKGIWKYSDPGRLLANALDSRSSDGSPTTTLLAEIGILQQSLISRACGQISAGAVSVVLVTGAESKYRFLRAKIAGATAFETVQENIEPDIKLQPSADLWSEVESAAGLGMPVGYYAIIDSALRYKQGQSVDQHRDEMAAMYARFSETAADNPDAWSDEKVDAKFIREHSRANRMLAFPYTKLHNSQWNVDQAAGLIFCSAKVATELGIDRRQWIFPRASTEANFMSVVAARKDLGSSPGFRIAGEVAAQMAGVNFRDLQLKEIYSCFPAAVRVQLEEFAMGDEGKLSVTGAMTFGGGPLNNFVLQATVKMAQLLREQPGEVGLVTSVSGMLTKQACALWSASPGAEAWAFADVSEQVERESEQCDLVAQYTGRGTIAGYTVLFQGDLAWRGVAVFDLPSGERTVAYTEDAVLIEQLQGEEQCGNSFALEAGQFSV